VKVIRCGIHIENLKIFSDLVESESFSRAAKLNGVTQSAVSQQMRAMEKHFSTLIVDRSQKQFRLTRAGEKLYESGKDILYRYDKLRSDLQEMEKIISGTIHLSTVYSIGLHELPPYIKAFLQAYPSVNVRVEYRRSNLVYDDILQNAVDLGLVAYPSKMRNLEVIPFHVDRLVLICHPEHPLAEKEEARIGELAGLKFVNLEADIPTGKAIDQIFRKAKIKIDPVMEFDNVETVKRAVEIDAGIAILPENTVKQEVKQGLVNSVALKGKNFRRPLAIIHRKGRVLTPAMKKFIANLKGELSKPDGNPASQPKAPTNRK
jgi:DNA-binding transcriptional LysR family regulator